MKRRSKLSAGTIYVIIIIVLVVAFASTILGGTPAFDPTFIPSQGVRTVNVDPNNIKIANHDTSGKKNLQLYTFFGSIQPLQTARPNRSSQNATSCAVDTNQAENGNCACEEKEVTCENGQVTQTTYEGKDITSATATKCPESGQNGKYCQMKPVIYLYPTHNTFVSVSVNVAGKIVASIPHYPAEGWQDVLAHPNGMLSYQGEDYHELFYEDSFSDMPTPATGIVLPTKNLTKELDVFTARLGLLPQEREEFLEFWIPRLRVLHMPYILFSVFSPKQKHTIDSVSISPRPDTIIEFLAYFKPLREPVASVQPLVLPDPPVRRGFTAVIWGGTIDR